MSGVVIKVENLYKEYRLGTISHGTLTQDLQSWWAKLRGKEDPNSIIGSARASAGALTENPRFLALNDVSFEVKAGEVLGIIGRNGAGKSTLLKILSRVTAPTSGKVKIRGRVASLLEVGTGFHPELTGRENIFLNGAILGMSKTEVRRKFDEIVAFSEVEKFIDTPVKRYSSGMYVRLAFSVAAHLEPEILIVDEVLAVGDAQFQKKCLGKMGEVSREGRTVLFVSHNMTAIQNLCSSAILLSNGRIAARDKAVPVIEKYISESKARGSISLAERQDRQGTGDIRFTAVRFQDDKGEEVAGLISGQDIRIVLEFDNRTKRDLHNVTIAVGIDNHLGERIALLSNAINNDSFNEIRSTARFIELSITRLPLVQHTYSFTIYCTINGVVADWIQTAGYFIVAAGDYYKSGKQPPISQGSFLFDYTFSCITE